jgi:hypothetical protein
MKDIRINGRIRYSGTGFADQMRRGRLRGRGKKYKAERFPLRWGARVGCE